MKQKVTINGEEVRVSGTASSAWSDPAAEELIQGTLNEIELQNYLKRLLGKTLTVIDASISEPVQRKAVKDVVTDQFWEAHWKLIDWLRNQQNGNDSLFPF